MTRRELLRRVECVGAAAAAGVFTALGQPADAQTTPQIVMVRGSLAALTRAYRTKKAGYTAEIREGADRVDGRCWTLRGACADGQIVERGGEPTDQGHTAGSSAAVVERIRSNRASQSERLYS